jgi:hypothetical protein
MSLLRAAVGGGLKPVHFEAKTMPFHQTIGHVKIVGRVAAHSLGIGKALASTTHGAIRPNELISQLFAYLLA